MPSNTDREFSLSAAASAQASLYTAAGERKYLTHAERQRALDAMMALPIEQRLFALTLAWTGGRISEVLALTPASLQVEEGKVALRTLKRRRPHVREVPIPPFLMRQLDEHFHISARQRERCAAHQRLWPWHRSTGWRIVKKIMLRIGVHGRRATPRGLRHAFGVGTLQSGAPLNLTQRWLGHARLSTTAIYADVSGAEEMGFAERFWCSSPCRTAR